MSVIASSVQSCFAKTPQEGGTVNEAQIKEAIEQVMIHCDLKMANYEMVSLRSCLDELGYGTTDTQEVIEYVANKGFDYCLDYTIKCKGPDGPEYPSSDVCYWGPDQLKSRLQFIR